MEYRLEGLWSTPDEINYLNGIGTHTVNRATRTHRIFLLHQYLERLDFRPQSERFIDFRRVRGHVEDLLRNPSLLNDSEAELPRRFD